LDTKRTQMQDTSHKCEKCGKLFRAPSLLKRHLARKTPCEPIIDQDDEADTISCKYCGRQFTTRPSMIRHIKQSCKIANSEEGMEKLVEHSLERKMMEMEAKMAELTTLLKAQQTASSTAVIPSASTSTTQIVQQVTNNVVNHGSVNNGIVNISIIPWDGDRIKVEAHQVAAAFAENSLLQTYASFDAQSLTDSEKAPPFVTELMMDLVKRAHANPAARNIYLNPRRSDQALVHMKSGIWEVLPLENATSLLFDGVAKSVHKMTMSPAEMQQLPTEAQNAMAMAGMMYSEEPSEYAKRAKAPMTAHLANNERALLQPPSK
jgi:DNA-directed RNA polymerase subunit RPC12/RpoP